MSGDAPPTVERFRRQADVLSRTTPAGAVLMRADADPDADPTVVSGPGGDLWELLSVERTRDELIGLLASRYDAASAAVAADLDAVLDTLQSIGLVERVGG